MLDIVGLWAFLGTLYLAIMTYQDYKHDRWVDDRKNYFMLGVGVAMHTFFERSIWYLLSVILVVVLFNYFAGKYKVVGGADISSFNWIYLGFAFINPYALLMFIVVMLAFTSVYGYFKSKVYKIKSYVPFMSIILLSFFFVAAIMGLYG
jgi:hypothetical protein